MKKVCVIGIETNGLIIAILAAQEGLDVVFVNSNKENVNAVNNGALKVSSKETQEALHFVLIQKNFKASVTTEPANYFIITSQKTNEQSLKSYSSQLSEIISSVGNHLKKDNHIIFSSAIPLDVISSLIEIAAHESGLEAHEDFFISYCSEKILPIQLINPLLIKEKNLSDFYHTFYKKQELLSHYEYLFLPASKLTKNALDDDYCKEEKDKEERELA